MFNIFKKAQGLPLTTIVLAILVLIVLITLAIFFFGGFGQAASGTRSQGAINKCQQMCASAAYSGDQTLIIATLSAQGFCNANADLGSSSANCGSVSPCLLRLRDSTCLKFDCTGPKRDGYLKANPATGCI